MHHALLAHANAVDVFRKGGYKGRIGVKIDGTPGVPLNASSKSDWEAVLRANDFEVHVLLLPYRFMGLNIHCFLNAQMGWDVAPLYTGTPSSLSQGVDSSSIEHIFVLRRLPTYHAPSDG